MKFTAAPLTKLQQHVWQGNMRELRNIVCRALLVRKRPKVDATSP